MAHSLSTRTRRRHADGTRTAHGRHTDTRTAHGRHTDATRTARRPSTSRVPHTPDGGYHRGGQRGGQRKHRRVHAAGPRGRARATPPVRRPHQRQGRPQAARSRSLQRRACSRSRAAPARGAKVPTHHRLGGARAWSARGRLRAACDDRHGARGLQGRGRPRQERAGVRLPAARVRPLAHAHLWSATSSIAVGSLLFS